jgi:hypothetical protein
MRLLKVAASYLITRNLRCNREYRNAIAMTIEEAVDEVKIAWTTTASAHSDPSREMGLRSGSKRRYLFMPHMQPFDLLILPDDVGQSVQGIADNAVNTLHAGPHQGFNEYLSHFLCHGLYPLRRNIALCFADIILPRNDQRHRDRADPSCEVFSD